MKKKLIYPLITFILISVGHAIYFIWKTSQTSKIWVQLQKISPVLFYFRYQEFFLGFSYALAGAFAIYALLKFLETHRSSVAGIVGGVTLTGILYIGGCFLLGCCGSPMLAVCLTLFGSSFLGFIKPLIFILTLVSVIIGYFWIKVKTKKLKSCCLESKK